MISLTLGLEIFDFLRMLPEKKQLIRRWYFSGFLLFILQYGLFGCGFQPIYKLSDEGTFFIDEELAAIEIALIPDREGQILRNHLISLLNARGETKPRYRLQVSLTNASRPLAVGIDAIAARANVTTVAEFALIQLSDERIVYQDRVRSEKSVTIGKGVKAAYQRTSVRADALQRTLVQVGNQIASRLAVRIRHAFDKMDPIMSKTQPSDPK